MEPVLIESNVNGASEVHNNNNANVDHGWQKVTYAKRQRKTKPGADPSNALVAANGGAGSSGEKNNVFRNLEQQAEERHLRIIGARQAALSAAASESAPARSKHRSDDEYDEDSDADVAAAENGKAEEPKKPKQKKPKKPKITVAEAAAKLDATDLSAFLIDISGTYEDKQDIQMMRFADYFGRAFSGVTASQFPWMKIFRESTVAKMADIPLSQIPDVVYKTSIDWINQRSPEVLGSFVLWCLDSILADVETHNVSSKASKKVVQQASSKSQVAIFVALAMVLRRKPDVLIGVLPALRENAKYQGQDKLPVIVWMIAQASQGELAVGLYSWAHNLLPIVGGKNCNPQSRDIILQLVERILSSPKARTILVNGAVRKGERLVPPSALETLLRLTFPTSSARVKATERFEAIYPTLKEVALAGVPGSKAMKQVSLQILSFAIKFAGESTPDLSNEAAGIFIWCLTQSADCYKHWDKLYEANLEGSVKVLKKLSEEWKEHSAKLSPLDPFRATLKSFRQKNEKGIGGTADAACQSLLRNADKYCKLVSGKLSSGHGCLKSVALAVIAIAVGAAFMSPNVESLDWEKISVFFTSQPSI
ncbi:hypothetical protein KPL70_004369 [Citrus sinensis]|uniref:Transmembrane protein 214-A n=1 Tax=Citrus sinensis TaxID=2711 RepID=A0A067FEM7_CITSI|nr:uncharacterized protein LOC102617537 [Citrus sinensis]KAH9746287.1 hypothetical protein KPL70_004369 [Citrus sinensis]KDO64590.1 hypothetical protein CISIN_1g007667mg [Citrus sinensis]